MGKPCGMKSARLSLFGIFSYLLMLQFVVCIDGLRLGPNGSSDFRQLFTAGYLVRSGQGSDLYNYDLEEQLQNRIVGPGRALPFDHLAYEAVLFAPFSMLSFSTAYFVFAGFNILLLVAAQRLFRPYLVPLEPLGKFVPDAIFYCFLPMAIAIILGQDSILLLVLAVLAFIALDKGHDLRSGLLLSLGLFKFQFILPVVLLFFLWRRWRFVFGAAIGGIGVVCLSTWIAGISGMRAFGKTMIDMSVGLSGQAQRAKFATFPSAMPNLRGFIDTVASPHLSAGAVQAGVIVSTLLVILAASRMRPSFHLAILASVLVSYHGLLHDSALLALPLGMILARSVSEHRPVVGAFDLLTFLCPAVLFQFGGGRFFPMAILILVLLFMQQSVSGAPLLNSTFKEASN
jgi:hypothetical protein